MSALYGQSLHESVKKTIKNWESTVAEAEQHMLANFFKPFYHNDSDSSSDSEFIAGGSNLPVSPVDVYLMKHAHTVVSSLSAYLLTNSNDKSF